MPGESSPRVAPFPGDRTTRDLARLAAQAAGKITAVADRSWARPDSAVWQVTVGSGRSWFVKRHRSPMFHHREVTAYRHWTGALGPGRAPVLAAADGETLAIVITGLPGQSVPGPGLSAGDEREVHRQAGMLFRFFHQAAPPAYNPDSTDRAASRVGECLRRAGEMLTAAQIQLVRRAADRLQCAARGLRAVPTHGDAQPRNWVWDPTGRQLALIDFERAESAPAVRDLVRLEYGPWIGDLTCGKRSWTGMAGRWATTSSKSWNVSPRWTCSVASNGAGPTTIPKSPTVAGVHSNGSCLAAEAVEVGRRQNCSDLRFRVFCGRLFPG